MHAAAGMLGNNIRYQLTSRIAPWGGAHRLAHCPAPAGRIAPKELPGALNGELSTPLAGNTPGFSGANGFTALSEATGLISPRQWGLFFRWGPSGPSSTLFPQEALRIQLLSVKSIRCLCLGKWCAYSRVRASSQRNAHFPPERPIFVLHLLLAFSGVFFLFFSPPPNFRFTSSSGLFRCIFPITPIFHLCRLGGDPCLFFSDVWPHG